jgi:hypothetical protein
LGSKQEGFNVIEWDMISFQVEKLAGEKVEENTGEQRKLSDELDRLA